MDIYLAAVVALAGLAVSDIIVGVSNDAVNFLNSSIGSKVASRFTIFSIASLGLLAGVTFSKGMMEVARKGIFHPQFFTMPDLITIFLAVMLTDIILLDMFNSFGLPTSTTVSIVFELLGAAVAISIVKMAKAGENFSGLIKYINTGKALAIIFGILLSVVVAFISGAVIQFFSRLIFTFDFKKRVKRYGFLWGGIALSSIMYFILIKGAKGSAIISKTNLIWIKSHTILILLISFVISALFLLLITLFTKINILKIIVLVGTFALAMAFAANDLVNFIGVPLAGLSAYKASLTMENPLTGAMTELQKTTSSHTTLLLIAGIIMAITLWVSRKARTVTKTELNLGRQDDGLERFGSSPLSRSVVRMFTGLSEGVQKIIPNRVGSMINNRFKYVNESSVEIESEVPSFDLIRASVNLMVASVLISFATSLKLPLSTTYVTFMVAMGTSFSDRAWGRDSAVYRVAGVLTVISGWFVTAFLAFTFAGILALVLAKFKVVGVFLIVLTGGIIIYRNHNIHKKREKESKEYEIFNLKKIKDEKYAISVTFEHAGYFLKDIADILKRGFDGVKSENRNFLRNCKKDTVKISNEANIITANIFKTLRLLQKSDPKHSADYSQTISSLQGIAECGTDIIDRAYNHINNNHKGLLSSQLEELNELKTVVIETLESASEAMIAKDKKGLLKIKQNEKMIKKLTSKFDKLQIKRIQDNSSKTRLSILFYGFTRDLRRIGTHTVDLINIFQDSF